MENLTIWIFICELSNALSILVPDHSLGSLNSCRLFLACEISQFPKDTAQGMGLEILLYSQGVSSCS